MTTRITDVLPADHRTTTPRAAVGHRYTHSVRPLPPGDRRTYTAHLDPERHIVAAEPDFARQFGRTSADTCGHSLYELLHPSSPTYLDRHFARLSEGRCNRFDERMVGLSGAGRVFSAGLTGIAVHDTGGDLAGIVVQVRPDQEGAGAPGGAEPATHPKERLLSKLDAQVLEGVAAGASTVQLAARLYLSRQGVEYHVGLMLRNLKAPNRAALVARAHSLGMLTVGQWPPRVPPEFIK